MANQVLGNIYQMMLKKHYTKIALIISMVITIMGLVTTMNFSKPTTEHDFNESLCKMSEFLNISAMGPKLRFCQSGQNINLNETINNIHSQINNDIISKFHPIENISNLVLNHIICILVTNQPNLE
jgi:hypothetical protein